MTTATTIFTKSNEEPMSLPDNSYFGLLIADHVDALLTYWDNTQVCRFANKAYIEWFGLAREEIVGKLNMKQLHGAAYELNLPYILAVLEGNLQHFEREIVTRSGEIRHSLVSYYPYIVDGEVEGFCSLITDISRQKNEEKKLSQLAAIVESSADAIISKKPDGTIMTWNKGAENILGYTFNEVSGKHISILFPMDFLEQENNLLARLLNGEKIEKYETTRVRKDKKIINVIITLSIIKDKQGNVLGISKVLRDITKDKVVEAELNASNEQNKIFIRQAPNAIAMFDKQMRYLAASVKWMEDYKLTGQKIIGRSHYDIFPEIGDDWKLIHADCLRGAINTCKEALFERADGTIQWLTWDVRPWYISEGIVGGLLMYTADITSIKEKDAERERIEHILEISNKVARIATWEIAGEPKRTSWSKLANEIFELPDDFKPDDSSIRDYYKSGENFDRLRAAVTHSIEHGTPYDLEAEIITGKGNPRWVRIIGNAEFVNGRCFRRFGVFQDITRAKKVESDLYLANEKMETLLNSGNVSIVACNLNGIITNFNTGAELLLQYKANELVGTHTPDLFHSKEEIIKRGAELSEIAGRTISGFDIFTAVANKTKFDSREWIYVRKDGTTFPVQLIISAIRNSRAEIVGYMGVATDITERKELEEKMRKYAILESKSKEMEQFAYIASHDLREPLLTIKSYLDLLIEDFGAELDEGAKHYTRSITNAANRMDDLIKGLLDYSRLSKIKQLQVVDSNKILAEVEEDLHALILSTGATIITGEMPSLRAYPLELKLLFQNLISNGLKFHRDNIRPVVEISATEIYHGWQFKVRDNGIGIDKKDLEKIFLMFQRLHNRSQYEGTGIGLTHCQKIAELHNGTIWVESVPGEFSSFYFTILT